MPQLPRRLAEHPTVRKVIADRADRLPRAESGTRSYISLVVKMNRENVRSTARSVANQEFHRSGEILNEAAREITRILETPATAP
jgi:hypothetical protein